jgi:hypothetical protein
VSRRGALLVAALLVSLGASGCGGSAVKPPSAAAQRKVTERFASAVFRGDVEGARSLLVDADEPALVFLVRRAAAPWRREHAAIHHPARRIGRRWTIRYSGMRTFANGRFERESGHLVVNVVPSADGARVRFFALARVDRRFSTHHDGLLLPSKR